MIAQKVDNLIEIDLLLLAANSAIVIFSATSSYL